MSENRYAEWVVIKSVTDVVNILLTLFVNSLLNVNKILLSTIRENKKSHFLAENWDNRIYIITTLKGVL